MVARSILHTSAVARSSSRESGKTKKDISLDCSTPSTIYGASCQIFSTLQYTFKTLQELFRHNKYVLLLFY